MNPKYRQLPLKKSNSISPSANQQRKKLKISSMMKMLKVFRKK